MFLTLRAYFFLCRFYFGGPFLFNSKRVEPICGLYSITKIEWNTKIKIEIQGNEKKIYSPAARPFLRDAIDGKWFYFTAVSATLFCLLNKIV